jgi:hypothetical protein
LFFFFAALTKAVMYNIEEIHRYHNNGYACFLPELKENALSFSALNLMLTLDFA